MFIFWSGKMSKRNQDLTGRYEQRIKGIEGEALEKLILKNIRKLIKKAAEISPLVIVLEDLHWADTSTLELMTSLYCLTENNRVLFINVFRPDYSQADGGIMDIIGGHPSVYYVEILLHPLDPHMSETLINNMLRVRGLLHDVRNTIIQRSGGNPFFIEEVVRSLIDEKAVIADKGGFIVTDKMHDISIPHTINDVLLARIDRLEEDTRHLIKVASVIGRSFFYKILLEMAGNIKDVDGRLSHLKEIQLIRDRKKKGELEYLFKHALAQEVAYESVLIQQRKLLHLQVAEAIEKIFQQRLREFYGMLAFHYSKAEHAQKAEAYLIKAGQEALTTSASAEALHYFKEALSLYRHMCGEDIDLEKIAMLEKNIAVSLYNRGQLPEAVRYFDKVLSFYGFNVPKNKMYRAVVVFIGFLKLSLILYLPFLKRKKDPTKQKTEEFNVFYKREVALTTISSKDFLPDSLYALAKIGSYDLTKISCGVEMFGGLIVIFSMLGVLPGFNRRIFRYLEKNITRDDARSAYHYYHYGVVSNYLSGDWNRVDAYNEDLINRSLDNGEIVLPSICLMFHGEFNIDMGDFRGAQHVIERLSEIMGVYDYDYAKAANYVLNSRLLMKRRRLHEALAVVKEGLVFSKENDSKLHTYFLHTIDADIHILMENFTMAQNSLADAVEYLSELGEIPYFHGWLLIPRFIINLQKVEESMRSGNRSAYKENRKQALRAGLKAIKVAKKSAAHRTEAYNLMGQYYQLTGKQKKALTWLEKSIKEGQHLNAKLELSRTYMTVGKYLLDPVGKYKTLNGLTGQDYIEKARSMFEEMNLQWDLDELEKIAVSKLDVAII